MFADHINTHLLDEAALYQFATALALTLQSMRQCMLEKGLVVYLQGPVGAGKTSFVRQLLRASGIQGPIRSPTYTLVEFYTESNLNLYHFDLYRFFNVGEWASSGFDELFGPACVALIEWPEKAWGFLPQPDILIDFDYANLDQMGRNIEVQFNSEHGNRCLAAWKKQWAIMTN